MNKRSYTARSGTVYDSYEAYCNSADLELYEIMIKLLAGTRTPQNDFEQKLLDEMKEIEKSGGEVDLTENSW